MQGYIGALQTRSVIRAPFVDFDDLAEFEALCSSTAMRYSHLIERVVDSHMKNVAVSKFEWSKRDEMLMGVAEFPELCEQGLAVLLRLTHKRGLRFLLGLNNIIVTAVTVACRTYCDVHRDSMIRDFNQSDARSVSLTANYVRDVKYHMYRAMLLTLGNIESDPNSMLNLLHRECFAVMKHPDSHDKVYIPRHRVREYALALACITHARLGCGADGEPLAGQRLHEDTLRLIVGMIDFH